MLKAMWRLLADITAARLMNWLQRLDAWITAGYKPLRSVVETATGSELLAERYLTSLTRFHNTPAPRRNIHQHPVPLPHIQVHDLCCALVHVPVGSPTLWAALCTLQKMRRHPSTLSMRSGSGGGSKGERIEFSIRPDHPRLLSSFENPRLVRESENAELSLNVLSVQTGHGGDAETEREW